MAQVRKTYEDSFGKFGAALGPLQFLETVAVCFYQSSLLNRVPKYIIGADDALPGGQATKVHAMPLAGLSVKPVYDEWDSATYALYLADVLRSESTDGLFSPPNQVMTWLNDEHGELKPELFRPAENT
jgi:hypothetical protein